MIGITPLETWIREKIHIGHNVTGDSFAEALKAYQLQRVNETIDYARRNTPFYNRRLAFLDTSLAGLSDITRIPFTYPSDLADNPFAFLAVRQDDVARIVTLRTSGSTGKAKRLFFTEADLELTIDFFHHGMSTLVRPGQKVAVLLPGERPDSVGDLLARGLRRMGVHVLAYGPVTDPSRAAETISSSGAHCLVGIPTQVLAVACSRIGVEIGKGKIESALLTTDYVPQAIAERLNAVWGCRVFNHYGMTESGLGGGVECEALDGYHLREADLFFEIVDHETGETCPAGTMGEVVFSTLTRQGMPLIRYRTGDIARFIPEPCPCGSSLRRMEKVRGRWEGSVALSPGRTLTLTDLDESLFRLPGLLDYRATISKESSGKFLLHIDVHGAEGWDLTGREIVECVNQIESVQQSVANGSLEMPVAVFSARGHWTTTGVAKRKIVTEPAVSI